MHFRLVSSNLSSDLAVRTTLAPNLAASKAMAAPMPLLEPVIHVTLPLRDSVGGNKFVFH